MATPRLYGLRSFLVAIQLLLAAGPVAAESRIGLIIGNSDYTSASLKLANPVKDAEAMRHALQQAGFETIVKLNVKRVDLYRAVDEFVAKISRDPHAVGLFYYAGHGVQVDGANYIIPVDANVQSVSDLEANAYDIGRVLRGMEAAQNELNIVILDACRDNPLPLSRGIERGLARMDAPNGTFIAYAAAPGHAAQDGAAGTNGVFTGELVKAMAEPGLPLEQMFKKVIAAVRADTHGRQQPWSEASIQGDFYFRAGAPVLAPASGNTDPKQIELAYWESIRNSRNPEDFRAYLKRYPQGDFATLAANRLTIARPPAAAPKAMHSGVRGVGAFPAPAQNQSGKRCASILERVQLGDTLNDEDRGYLKDNCR